MELKPKILLFDLDQTLLRSSWRLSLIFVFQFYRVFKKAGLKPSKIIPFLRELRSALESPESIPNGESLLNGERTRGVAKRYGLTQTIVHEGIAEIFTCAIKEFSPLEEALAVFYRLKGAYRVVLATNPMWPIDVLKIRLARTGLKIEDFEFVTHAGNMHFGKTSARYYEELIYHLGAKPTDCLMIGDSERKDGIATQVGIPVFLIRNHFERKSVLLTEGRITDLEVLLQGFSIDGVITNLRSQSGMAKNKWEALSKMIPKVPFFRLETLADEEPLLDWLKAKVLKGQDRIAVAGGDGSVNWVLNLVQKNNISIRLGMIGLGSSNDYHKPMERFSISRWNNISFRTRFSDASPADLLKIEWTRGETRDYRFSALNGSMGFTAFGNHEFNLNPCVKRVKRISVNLAIFLSALRTLLFFKPEVLSVSVDQAKPAELNLANLSFYKNRYFSGDFRYETEVSPDSSDFGIAWIENQSKIRLIQILIGLARGRSKQFKELKFVRGKTLHVSRLTPFYLEIDGEIVHADSVQVTIEAGRTLLCP